MRKARTDTLPLVAQPTSARVLTHGLDAGAHERVRERVVCSELVALAVGDAASVCEEIRAFEPDLVVLGCADDRALVVLRQLKILPETHFIPVVVVGAAELRRAAFSAGADHVTESLDDDMAARAEALVRSAVAARAVRASRQELRLRRDWMRYLVHDLRNLLTKALGHLAQAGRFQLPDSVDGYLSRCEEELWRGSALLGDLLDVDRIRKGSLNLRRTPTDLVALAARAGQNHLDAATRAGVEIVVETSGPVTAAVDAALIERVIANLLDNGLRFAPAGTALRVIIAAGDDVARIAVENRGPPIPPERAAQIFEPFVTEGDAGTGLGLAFCRLVAEVHDGNIAVAEPDGGGARFTVTLPLSTSESR